mgnify:CR=1 FL=1
MSKIRLRMGLIELMRMADVLNVAECAPAIQALAVVHESAVCNIADLPSGYSSCCCA